MLGAVGGFRSNFLTFLWGQLQTLGLVFFKGKAKLICINWSLWILLAFCFHQMVKKKMNSKYKLSFILPIEEIYFFELKIGIWVQGFPETVMVERTCQQVSCNPLVWTSKMLVVLYRNQTGDHNIWSNLTNILPLGYWNSNPESWVFLTILIKLC